jgi:hypothetical protein
MVEAILFPEETPIKEDATLGAEDDEKLSPIV